MSANQTRLKALGRRAEKAMRKSDALVEKSKILKGESQVIIARYRKLTNRETLGS